MSPADAFAMYHAVKLHFDSETYDVYRFKFKTKTNGPKFYECNRGKYVFQQLAKKYIKCQDLLDLYVANFIKVGTSIWSGHMISKDAELIYSEWKCRRQSMLYNFKNDISILGLWASDNQRQYSDLFISKNWEWPQIVSIYTQGRISMETLTLIDIMDNFMEPIIVKETIFWPDFKRKVKKYRAFMWDVDIEKCKKIILSEFTST